MLKDYPSAMLDFAGTEISKYIREHIDPSERLLDAGAGWGKYRFLLPEYEMDAVDIWEPYIKKEKLDAYYRMVYIHDLYDFVPPQHYAAITMGDTLEHIPVERAQQVVRNLIQHCDHLLVATPFLMHQDAVHGNPHEAHQQEDLTMDVMAERYPELELYALSNDLHNEHRKSIYIWRKK